HLAGINSRYRAYDCDVAPEDLLACVGYLAQRRAFPRGVHCQFEEIPVARFGALRYRFERKLHGLPVALFLQLLQPLKLRLTDGGVVHLKYFDVGILPRLELVYADYNVLPRVYPRLLPRGG